MPIYEYYCANNHKIYSFYAKTLAQGQTVPRCPDNPAWRMQKIISPFAVTGRAREPKAGAADAAGGGGGPADDARMEAALSAMESEFSNVDENDPRAMGRMMRRMSEMTGEPLDGEMEEVVRKLEEGADPDELEAGMGEAPGGPGDPDDPMAAGPGGAKASDAAAEARHRYRLRRGPPERDPVLHDYD
jgi:hypothetical protein